MKSQSEWIRVSKSEPCPICQHSDWCSIAGDSMVACCMRVESDKAVESGGWIHRLNGNPVPQQPRRVQPTKKRLSANELHAKWGPIARQMRQGTEPWVKRLAKSLRVASWALDELRVGYGELSGSMCWTFPEQSARGQIVGINRRLVTPIDGENKRCAPGSRRGLSYSFTWDVAKGPIHIVEGGSDTAAGLTLGLCVVGRPSNLGGLNYLGPLLRTLPGRRIVIFGERDRKHHDELKPVIQKRHDPKCRGCISCWPGKFGAICTAVALGKRLDRRVEWRLLPDKAKDLREWLNTRGVDVEDTEATFELGRRISGV